MKNKFTILSVIALSIFLVGCSTTLDPTGVYGAKSNGSTLYQADTTIVTSYQVLDSFVSWESVNHAYLLQWPQISTTANTIRANAQKWVNSAVALRDAYQTNSSSANATSLQTSLGVLSAAAAQATTYLTTTAYRPPVVVKPATNAPPVVVTPPITPSTNTVPTTNSPAK